MEEKTKKKLKIATIKVLKILLILLVVVLIYDVGRFRGFFDGVYITQLKHNETVCDFLNKTRDIDGFCIILEEEQEYRYYLDCGWERFKVKGKEKPPFLLMMGRCIRQIIYYPVLGC